MFRFGLGVLYGVCFLWLLLEMPLGEIALVYEGF